MLCPIRRAIYRVSSLSAGSSSGHPGICSVSYTADILFRLYFLLPTSYYIDDIATDQRGIP